MSLFDFLSGIPKDQISPRGVQWMMKHLDGVHTEILQFMEPGKELPFEAAVFIPNAMSKFGDAQIGSVHGQGSGHAFLRVSALREVSGRRLPIDDFASLVWALRKCGYKTKQVGYIRVL